MKNKPFLLFFLLTSLPFMYCEDLGLCFTKEMYVYINDIYQMFNKPEIYKPNWITKHTNTSLSMELEFNGDFYRIFQDFNNLSGSIEIYSNNKLIYKEATSPFGIGFNNAIFVNKNKLVIYGIYGSFNGKGGTIALFDTYTKYNKTYIKEHFESNFSDYNSFILINNKIAFLCFDRPWYYYDSIIPNVFLLDSNEYKNITDKFNFEIFDIRNNKKSNLNKFKELNEYKYLKLPRFYAW